MKAYAEAGVQMGCQGLDAEIKVAIVLVGDAIAALLMADIGNIETGTGILLQARRA